MIGKPDIIGDLMKKQAAAQQTRLHLRATITADLHSQAPAKRTNGRNNHS